MIGLDGYEFHIQWIMDNIISYINHMIQMHNEFDNQNIKFDNNSKHILQCLIFHSYI